MKKTILIIEGIIAAIAILAVVIVCLLPKPEKKAPSQEAATESPETSETGPRESLTEAPETGSSSDALTEPPTEPSTVPPTDPPTEPPTVPPTEPPTVPPTEPPTETDPPAPQSADYSKIVFVGDSRTKTMASGGNYEFRLVPDDSVSATWGGTLYDGNAQRDVTNAVFKKRPIMVFWYGINDVQMHPERDNVDIFIQNYDKLLSLTAENPGCTVYVLSILTTTIYERDYYEGQNENIRRYNEALSAYCASHGYVYVDITALLTGDDCFYPGDNIHFSEAWYQERFLPTVLKRVGLLN